MSSCFVRLCYKFGPFVSSGQGSEGRRHIDEGVHGRREQRDRAGDDPGCELDRNQDDRDREAGIAGEPEKASISHGGAGSRPSGKRRNSRPGALASSERFGLCRVRRDKPIAQDLHVRVRALVRRDPRGFPGANRGAPRAPDDRPCPRKLAGCYTAFTTWQKCGCCPSDQTGWILMGDAGSHTGQQAEATSQPRPLVRCLSLMADALVG